MSRESTKGDYIWTAHALRQMKRRRITSEQVLTALNDPELPEVSRTTGSLCHRHGRVLPQGQEARSALNAAGWTEVATTAGRSCHRHTCPDGRTLKVWVSPGTRGPRSIKSAAWEGEDD